MAQGANLQDDVRMAAELAKRIQRDRSKLERAYQAMEQSGDSSEFLESLVNAATEAAEESIRSGDQDAKERITPNQPIEKKRKRKEPKITKTKSRRSRAKEEAQFQPFISGEEDGEPLLIQDDSLERGIYPANDEEETQEDLPPEQQHQEQSQAANLTKQKQQAKQSRRGRDQTAQAAAFAKKYDIEAPAELEQKAQGARGQIANEGAKFGAALKKRIDEGDFKSFAIALFIAVVKDVIDWLEPSGIFINWIVNPTLSVALYVIIRSEYGFVGRMVRKYMYRRLWKVIIVEFIPFLTLLPLMTMFILSMAHKVRKEKQKNILALQAWKREQKKILQSPLFRKRTTKPTPTKQAA